MVDIRTDLKAKPAPEECLAFDDFVELFGTRLERVMDRHHRALKTSPRAAFEADPRTPDLVDPRLLALILLRRSTVQLHHVGGQGIEFHDRQYVAPELSRFVGMKVDLGWKGRAELHPPELAVFLADEQSRRMRRAQLAEYAARDAADLDADTMSDEERDARRPSGPLIDARGGREVEDFLCLAIRSDLAGPDIGARITAGRERQMRTVRDAERMAQGMRFKLLPAPPETSVAEAKGATPTMVARRDEHRRALRDRERERGTSGS